MGEGEATQGLCVQKTPARGGMGCPISVKVVPQERNPGGIKTLIDPTATLIQQQIMQEGEGQQQKPEKEHKMGLQREIPSHPLSPEMKLNLIIG